MGEYSKLVGDIGEEIVSKILGLLGWANHSKNNYIDCNKKAHAVKTHGIDGLFAYESPLESGTIDNVLVSSKFSASPYSRVNSTFKSHLQDLAYALECYARSPLKKEVNDGLGLSNSLRKNEVGVLFYINNDMSVEKQDIISQVKSIRINPELKFKTIHLVDNARAAFLYKSISYVRGKNVGKNVYFFYPQTSLNFTGLNKKYYGKILPVDYISSPIIPFFIENGGDTQPTVCLVTSLSLTKTNVEYLVSFVRDLVSDVTKDLLFLFPNYNQLLHADMISKINMGIRQREEVAIQINVGSYSDDFRGEE
ncbi:GapS4a family protein [Serratia fonticola]|uniref:GapS4a family protein n=1 Tax=Serratia fonticola TaxID=47917 RepID=UPI000E0E6CE8|nr:hypothetical protein [Serratia fonticola]RDL15985.1 hypothetical protein DFO62_12282 [Serratia fonticola]